MTMDALWDMEFGVFLFVMDRHGRVLWGRALFHELLHDIPRIYTFTLFLSMTFCPLRDNNVPR